MKPFEQAWTLLKTNLNPSADVSNTRPYNQSKLTSRQTILPIDGQKGFLSQSSFDPNNLVFTEGPYNFINRKYGSDDDYEEGSGHRGEWQYGKEERIKKPPSPIPSPSHIEWNPEMMDGSYNLRGEDGELLSQIMPGWGGSTPPKSVFGFSAQTPMAYRRQGHYNKLMRGLINAGISVRSDERNTDSQGFHEEFQNRMTPNMKIEYGDETDGSHMQPFTYSRKPMRDEIESLYSDYTPTYGDSDLAQRDYGAMPIRIAPPRENRLPPNPIGSKQTKLFENGKETDYHWTDSLVNPSSLQYDPNA